MNGIEAFILGIIQGLTEYLPVSSSGHLALGSALFNLEGEENLKFTVIVHIATVFSTLVIFRKEIIELLKGLLKFKYNEETKYIINILYSMIPIGIIGLFFKDEIEAIFGSGLLIVGVMFIVTALFLSFSYYFKQKSDRPLTPVRSFVIGVAQALAVLPGLSRSGSTIATGLVLGVNKAKIAQFSFLMVIPPILGEALLDSIKLFGSNEMSNNIAPINLLIGFVAAFISGCIACKWMINIVKKGKLIYFALYCFILGIATIITSQLQ